MCTLVSSHLLSLAYVGIHLQLPPVPEFVSVAVPAIAPRPVVGDLFDGFGKRESGRRAGLKLEQVISVLTIPITSRRLHRCRYPTHQRRAWRPSGTTSIVTDDGKLSRLTDGHSGEEARVKSHN